MSQRNKVVTKLRQTDNEKSSIKYVTERLNRFSIEVSLLFSGVLLFVSFESLIYLTKLDRSNPIFILGFFFPFSAFLLATFLIRHTYDINTKSNYFLPIIFIFATIFQIVILLTEVTLSDDIYRFFEEGKAIVHGINPYITPIEDFPSYLKDPYIDHVNNANVTSPYPPLALLLFAILYFIFPDPIIYRLCFSVGFLISILFFNKIISYKNKWKLIIYAWNPLLHLETANGSHFDALVVLLVMIATWALSSERPATAGGFFLLSFLLKFYPLFLVVIYWKHLKRSGLTIFLSGLAVYGLFIVVEPRLIGGVLIFGQSWYFNANIFWLLVQFIRNFLISKIIVGILFIFVLARLAFLPNNEPEPSPAKALTVIGLFLLFSPTFHPWYIFWIFPFVLLDNKFNFSWILLSGLLVFSYHVYIMYDITREWVESDIIRLAEYIPFYIVLFLENRGIIREFFQKFQAWCISKG